MVVITDPTGKVRKRKTRAEIEEEKRLIAIQKAQAEAKASGQLSATQAQERTKEQVAARQEAAAAIRGPEPLPEEQVVEPVVEPVAEEQPRQPTPVEALIGAESPIGQLTAAGAGQTLTPEQTEFLGTAIPAAGGLGVAAGAAALTIPSLKTGLTSFLSKASTTGKIASRAKGVLSAPVKAKAASSSLRTSAITILGFAGLGSAKSITSNLLTAKVTRIEAEVTKVGEQLTKIPEASKLGFSLDENGELFEYTQSMALADIAETEQALLDAEAALKQASIGQTILKITGRYNTAQAEIDKQKAEIRVARGKVLDQLANPPESLVNSRDFFRGLELEE